MSDLVQRLRDADLDSVQRTNGSRIFGEAATEIERLTARNKLLTECQSNLSADKESLTAQLAESRDLSERLLIEVQTANAQLANSRKSVLQEVIAEWNARYPNSFINWVRTTERNCDAE